MTERERAAVEGAANVWTLIEHDGAVELLRGLHSCNRLGHFITEIPHAGETAALIRLSNSGNDTPERAAMALVRAQQMVAVGTAGEHERDLEARKLGQVSEAEYRANEGASHRDVDGVKVFFNLRLNEYCVEDVAWKDIPCGRCGTPDPGDPCRSCGRSQPVAFEDYYRINNCAIELPETGEAEVPAAPLVGDYELLPF